MTNKKYVGLKKSTFKRPQQQFVDQDYIRKLSDEHKQWLSKFNNEYYNGYFDDNPLHETKEEQRECWRRQRKSEVDITSSNATEVIALEQFHENHMEFDSIEQVEILMDLLALTKGKHLTIPAIIKLYQEDEQLKRALTHKQLIQERKAKMKELKTHDNSPNMKPVIGKFIDAGVKLMQESEQITEVQYIELLQNFGNELMKLGVNASNYEPYIKRAPTGESLYFFDVVNKLNSNQIILFDYDYDSTLLHLPPICTMNKAAELISGQLKVVEEQNRLREEATVFGNEQRKSQAAKKELFGEQLKGLIEEMSNVVEK